ncbi:hypothetical protein PHYSODRAFT_314785 [Phytophthora sojae]|uniref:Uncharacterized protein n=1 Tax=Phytophthora sojae (strain P6497) TaxID=1094619 RepID=G4ZE65_PHYSP|nr:hypothetical protein PHYSODRAFT_314785 [Phytophthora sojae]EGZ17416.1 hypothetical protein PHYSODRAFT_314785 [Phytophthora sojae]|eukprot:XP_009526474.1 hypothetical protein PHYSODRAFT_314785 [Phytophthora sojae]
MRRTVEVSAKYDLTAPLFPILPMSLDRNDHIKLNETQLNSTRLSALLAFFCFIHCYKVNFILLPTIFKKLPKCHRDAIRKLVGAFRSSCRIAAGLPAIIGSQPAVLYPLTFGRSRPA